MQPQANAISPMPTVLSTSEGESYYSTETIRDASSTTGSGKGSMRMINSKVIAASINSTKPRRKLTEPVLFTLQHLEVSERVTPLFCWMHSQFFTVFLFLSKIRKQLASTRCKICQRELSSYGFARRGKMLVPDINF